jgi:hypothetical protein
VADSVKLLLGVNEFDAEKGDEAVICSERLKTPDSPTISVLAKCGVGDISFVSTKLREGASKSVAFRPELPSKALELANRLVAEKALVALIA